MHAAAHVRVVVLAADAMPDRYAPVVARLWEGIEMGATVPDELRFLWDVDDQVGVIARVLMHRCFMDSDKPRDRGCPIQIARYATGIPGFFEDYARGELEGAYDDEEFVANAGVYFGFVSHHIADLHSPPHVGKSLDAKAMGFRDRGRLHARVEVDLDRAARSICTIAPYRPTPIELTTETFELIAESVYYEAYLALPRAYGPKADAGLREDLLCSCVRKAAQRTADVWAVVLGLVSPAGLRALVR